MKNIFSKLFFVCFGAFFIQNFALAQTAIQELTVPNSVATRAVTTRDAAVLVTYFQALGYEALPIDVEDTYSIAGRDAAGAFSVQLVNQGYRNRTGQVDITTITTTRNGRAEYTTFAQNEIKTFKVVEGIVQESSPPFAKNIFSWLDQECFKYLTGGVDCGNLKLCIKGCIQNNNKWWKKYKCALKCVKSFVGCEITNYVMFMNCLLWALIKGN